MTRLLLVALLVWPLTAVAGPRVSLLFPPSPAAATPQVRERIESALLDHGAVIVPSPIRPTTDREVRSLARRLGVDGVVELRIRRVQPNKYHAELRVLDSAGAERLKDDFPLAGRRISEREARSLATLAVGALAAPKEAKEEPPPPPPPVAPEKEIQDSKRHTAEATTPTPPELPVSFVPAPRADSRRTLNFWAAGTGTWRSAAAGATPSANALRFGTSAPYGGMTLGFATQPFLRPSLRWLGFDVAYSFSYAHITAPAQTTTGTNTGTVGLNATQHQFVLDAVGHLPLPSAAGFLSLSVGLAYEGFLVPFTPPLVSATYFSPRFLLGYQTPQFHSVAIGASFGYRPFVDVGSDLQRIYGPPTSSFGIEAHAGLSGSLERLVSRLRWTAGYDFLRYSDNFAGLSGAHGTPFAENYHGFSIGLLYSP